VSEFWGTCQKEVLLSEIADYNQDIADFQKEASLRRGYNNPKK